MSKERKILLVDDEPDILEMLQYNLEKEGFVIEKAADGKEAVEKAKSFLPQLILMDVMMPKMDGIEACRKIREDSKLKNVFILFLTSRSEEYSEIAAFEGGANDYITKPIKPRALVSRIVALFKRDAHIEVKKESFTLGEITIDKESYTVTKKGEKLNLPKKEFELLYFLFKHPNTVFTRDQILNTIWGDVYVVPRTVDVHIRKLREKIGEEYIRTIKGIGYKLEVGIL